MLDVCMQAEFRAESLAMQQTLLDFLPEMGFEANFTAELRPETFLTASQSAVGGEGPAGELAAGSLTPTRDSLLVAYSTPLARKALLAAPEGSAVLALQERMAASERWGLPGARATAKCAVLRAAWLSVEGGTWSIEPSWPQATPSC